jgi:hypothetical protein
VTQRTAVLLGDLAGGEMAYPLELEAEEQDEGQGPVQERADEERVLGRLAGQVVLEPGGDAFKVLVALGQDTGLD